MMLTRSVLVFVVLSACSICRGESSSEFKRSLCQDVSDEDDDNYDDEYDMSDSVTTEAGIINGGEDAPRDKWPWLVVLFNKSDNTFFCAGSLISERFVVTAAHCIWNGGDEEPRNPKDVNVYLGKWNLSDTTEQDVVLATPQEFIVHADWDVTDTKWDVDIAIIQLTDNVTYSRSVQPVGLWTSQMQRDKKNDVGVVVAWVKMEGDGDHSEVPRDTKVPILYCEETEGRRRNAITREGLCVRKMREGPCNTDDGGGLFTARGGKWFLRGITSGSEVNDAMECCASFTKVEQFIPWINQVLDGDETMKCEFQNDSEDYKCKLQNAFARSDTQISQVIGSHTRNLTNEDVLKFYAVDDKNLKFLPISLGRYFPNLEHYSVIRAGLRKVSRKIFVDLPALTDLWIIHNPLKVIPGDTFYDLTMLKNLWLSNNKITAIDSSMFIHNTQLVALFLQHNRITSLHSSTFRNNLELVLVDFNVNMLTSIGPELMTPLRKLEFAGFGGNKCIDFSWRNYPYLLDSEQKDNIRESFARRCK